ncbi:hypothetical protein, partial [Thiolapillus sp.]|uniref:hypothetical protein n=1 Tax=Thiolapillus sp. TaxID=2017437 RepID=UPI003AF499D4
CASFMFTLATNTKISAKHPKVHKNDPNTKRLAPTGNFLNVTITVNKSSHLLSKSKRKEKKLILCSHPSTFFLHENILFYNTLFIFNFNLINHKGVFSLS